MYTNESILNECGKDYELYKYLINKSKLNPPNLFLNIKENEMKDCVSQLWCNKIPIYLNSNSDILNGVCYLITELLKNNIEPTFYLQLELANVKGLTEAIKKLKS